jgi:hypothetical protein
MHSILQISHSLDGGTVSLIFSDKIPSKRLIYSSTGPVHRDFDDVRRYTKAGISAGEKYAFNLRMNYSHWTDEQ